MFLSGSVSAFPTTCAPSPFLLWLYTSPSWPPRREDHPSFCLGYLCVCPGQYLLERWPGTRPSQRELMLRAVKTGVSIHLTYWLFVMCPRLCGAHSLILVGSMKKSRDVFLANYLVGRKRNLFAIVKLITESNSNDQAGTEMIIRKQPLPCLPQPLVTS